MYDPVDLAFAYGAPIASGVFKASTDDFKVDERLGFELSGAGEHLFLRVEKRGLNTEELVKRLAMTLNKPVKSISYAGLKDRLALTTQWLSVHCPGEDIPDASSLEGNQWRVIQSGRHLKKLKKGGLESNLFTMVLRDLTHHEDIEHRLACIKAHGVPNYFGPQRFGHHGQNIQKAEDMLLKGKRVKDRFLRGLYYSTARSFLFNRILSERVAHRNWNRVIPGDVVQLAGTHSVFCATTPDHAMQERATNHDLSPASTLWGKGNELVRCDALIMQQTSLTDLEPWCRALEQHELIRAYRAHVLCAQHMTWVWQDANLVLSFELTAGSFATSVLRELIATLSASPHQIHTQ